ncbi:hypothetical protein PTMSG1_08713 [Pyrenophora teres f. maculata]|nr:hypothetical protein PTMSG1_08713 [Pyrenophora teres f. maculata]
MSSSRSSHEEKNLGYPIPLVKKRAASDESSSPLPLTKRQKEDPPIIASEARYKAERRESKAAKSAAKKNWEAWVEENNCKGMLLPHEPTKDEAITQTDSVKRYSLKPAELVAALHWEKKKPMYGGTMKLFNKSDVKDLACRKLAMLAGVVGDNMYVLDKAKDMWKEQNSDEDTWSKSETPKEETTPEEKWAEYITTHSLTTDNTDGKLSEEPTVVINRSESLAKYHVTRQDLDCLPCFSKTARYGVMTKLYKKSEVRLLAYRKMAVLAGAYKEFDDDDLALLQKGEELFKEHKKKEEE